jgi:radical SAM superfamily enzyme YgiQ (UPF0313 family)
LDIKLFNILLIQPAWDGLSYRRKIKVDERAIHPLSLGTVAALSGDHKITIINEAMEPLPPDVSGYDLVGISVNTFTAPRAFKLALSFRKEGVPVVFGGVHTSLMPEDCLNYADSIIVGDAEDTWPVLLEDFRSGSMKQIYHSQNIAQGKELPAPRRDLFRATQRKAAYFQVSRGCSNECRFCYLQYVSPGSFRVRDIGEVYKELEGMPESIILFGDDNLFCDLDYTRSLFQEITPLQKKWWIQAPTNLEDEELINVLSRSGCFSMSIGFQTSSDFNNQNEGIKQNNVNDYERLVRMLQKNGILVDGTFIFGFDGDTHETFSATEDLIRKLGLDTYTFYFLTPYPGTTYHQHFSETERIVTSDLSLYDWDHVVVNPLGMSVEDLKKGVHDLYKRLDKTYMFTGLLQKAFRFRKLPMSRDLLMFIASLGYHYRVSPISR